MFTLSHLTSPPPETFASQVQQMALDYLTDLSPTGIAASNPLYALYQYALGLEVHQYLTAMDGSRDIPVQLLLALDEQDPAIVLGFALLLPVLEAPEACVVQLLAVKASHRRRGIARALLDAVVLRHPHVELACAARQVPWFQAMGLQVVGARGPQVLMNTRDHRTEAELAVLDIAPIFRTKEVGQIHAYLLKQQGERAMREAEKQRDRTLDHLTWHAETLVRDHLGEAALQQVRPMPRLV